MTSPIQRLRGASTCLILVSAAAAALVASASERTHKILSLFFDGVPTPAEKQERKEKKEMARLAKLPKKTGEKETPLGLPGEPAAPAPTVKVKLPIENLKTWEEVLKVLPTDFSGGPDWVKAVKDGILAPIARVDPPAEAPFTLDTLVPGVVSEAKAALALDIELVPEKAPFYKVQFPHSSHTLWLNCSSCHPGILSKRASMQKIFAGEYCGVCHGKVPFDPLTSCGRCHVNLVPPEKEKMDGELAQALEKTLPGSPEAVERGKTAYLEACAICHGEKGDGKGPLGAVLDPKPRNFTTGKFKFRSTGTSSPPTDYDLFRTITRGIPGTSMPSFSMLPYENRFGLVHYVKTFSERFVKEKPAAVVPIPEPPPKTPELMALGQKFYKEAECFKCHGESGRGDGPSAPELKDDWEEPLKPFDFTKGRPKSGSTLKDYYRVVVTGLQGTPMPDYGDVFEGDQAWAVIQYVYSLGDEKRGLPPAVKGDIAFERKVPEQGEKVPPALFPHWFHRIRFRCAVCHPSVFVMKAGSNVMTMDEMRQKKFCGKCHNGTVAWAIAFETCVRCHPEQ